MKGILVKEETEKVEREVEFVKTKWLMDNHIKMDDEIFDTLNRKVSILDIDFADQEVILRADLDVPMSQFTPMPPIEEEFKSFFEAQAEASVEEKSKKKQKKNKRQQEEEVEQMALLE